MKGVEDMKFYLKEDAIRNVLEKEAKPVRYIGEILEISTQEVYNKLNNKTGLDIKQLNKLCNTLLVSSERILTEESIEEYEEYKKDMEFLDGLNAQY